jgi:tRNA (Thr-GGU) A37 N-methylase
VARDSHFWLELFPARQDSDMPIYAVLIDASNFLIDIDGATAKHGLFTTRVVEAANPAAAELAAVQMLRDDQDLRSITLNAKDDPPVMDIQGISEVESMPDTQSGKVWYKMEMEQEPKRWWHFWK